MSVHCDVGKISVSPKGVLWALSDFSSLPQIRNTEICSPYFTYGNKRWRLYAYPNGHSSDSSLGWFGILADEYHHDTIVELGITNERQEYIVSSRAEKKYNWYDCTKLISRTDFDSRKNEIMPRGKLHILFRIVNEIEESTVHTVWNKTEDGKGSEEIPAYVESSTQTEEASGAWMNLKEKFEKMLLNESITDIILKVQGQEFKAHRFILAAHSPVFLAMMSHDTKEKASGVVDIEDSDPNIFPDFLHFLYTGNVENLTPEKALKLYLIADKYQVTDLKQICISHLLTNISVEKFCDVFVLSLQHNETHLKDACIGFFQEKSLDILMTTNWQNFISENPIIGNELFIKHLQLIKSDTRKK